MGLFVRERSRAYRLKEHGIVLTEQHGRLHWPGLLLEWGSITKTVTAAVAHRLAEVDALNLSVPVTEYLPSASLSENVTVDSLIEHTSGLPRIPTDMFTDPKDLVDPYARYTNEYFDTQVIPHLHEKNNGTVGVYDYSNLGYAVLTRILETATGRSWWELADELVLTPAGVTDATITPDPAHVAVLHTWTGKVRKQWTDVGPFIGAGGLVSTFDGLEQYAHHVAQSLRAGESLLGWQRTGQFVWHNGHNRDHGAFVGFTPDLVVTVHTLGYRSGTADRIATRLLHAHARDNDEQTRPPLGCR